MTGEKNRGTTQERLWKLDDPDLATPKHDELVIKLLDPKYCVDVIPQLKDRMFSICSGYFTERDIHELTEDRIKEIIGDIIDHYSGISYNGINISARKLCDLSLLEKVERVFCLYENEYKDYDTRQIEKRKYLINELYSSTLKDKILDNYIIFKRNVEPAIKSFSVVENRLKIKSEVPIISNNKFIIGYWDIQISIERSIYYENIQISETNTCPIFIEVKPHIDSFGRVLRQLNTYKEYFSDPFYIILLFTPDIRFDAQFESQGIQVVHPPNGGASDGELRE